MMIKNMLYRIIGKFASSVGVTVLALVLVLPMTASAGYVDEEVSAGNSMTAGSLDMVLSEETAISGVDLLRGGASSNVGEVTVTNSGTVDADYSVQFVKTGGDDVLCDELVLNAKKQGADVYNGLLINFAQSAGSLAASGAHDWDFAVSLPTGTSDTAMLKSCSFDIKFSAAQSGLSGGGYSDDEVFVGHSVTSGDWVAPAAPTGLRILDHNGANLSCEGFTNNRFITVDWDDNTESDLHNYDYMKREGTIIAHPTNSEYSGNIRNRDSYYKYQVRGVDNVGNTGAWSGWCGVTLDRVAPVSTFTSPTDDQEFAGTPIAISGSTTDNTKVASVELVSAPYDTITSTCGSTYTTITTLTNPTPGASYSWSYDWTPAAAGSYCIKAHGTDVAGNVEASPLVKNVVYNPTAATGNAPIISNIQVIPGSVSGVLATVTWTTDISATSNVLFGPHSVSSTGNTSADLVSTYSFASPTPTDISADNTSHSIDLIPTGPIGSPMYFRVVSKNASGQETMSAEQAFLIDFDTENITFLPDGSFAQSTTNPTTGQTPNATNTISLPVGAATGSVGFAQSSTPPATTGQAVNVGDIVLNEIMPDPNGSETNKVSSNCAANGECGEWVELYNTTDIPINVVDWYIKDAVGTSPWQISAAVPSDDQAYSDNDGVLTGAGETIVPANGYLVIYRNRTSTSGALNNNGDTAILYSNTDILMDTHSFDEDDFYEGKSIARFPDGVGVWVDPEGTPGQDNKLGADELEVLRGQTFEQCFASSDQLENSEKGTLCDPMFLEYIGMIDDVDSQDLALTELLPIDDEVSEEEEIIAQIEADEEVERLAQIEEDSTNPLCRKATSPPLEGGEACTNLSALAGTSPSKGEEEIATPALEENVEVAPAVGVVDEIVEEKAEVAQTVGVVDEVLEVDNGAGGTALIAGGEVVATDETVDGLEGEVAQIEVEGEGVDEVINEQNEEGSEQVAETVEVVAVEVDEMPVGVVDIDEVELVQDGVKEEIEAVEAVEGVEGTAVETSDAKEDVEAVEESVAQEVEVAEEVVEIEEIVEVDEVLEQDKSDEQVIEEKLEESKKVEKQVLDIEEVEEVEVIEDNQSGGGDMDNVVETVGVGIDSAGAAN